MSSTTRQRARRARRRLAVVLSIMLLVFGGWSWIGDVDVVAVAEGRVIPTARVKRIQPVEQGQVRAIRVDDGDRVRAGAVLVELDVTLRAADRDRLANNLLANRVEIARLRALAEPPERALASFSPPDELDAMGLADHRALLAAELDEHRARLAALDADRARSEAHLGALGANARRLERTLPLIGERARARRILADQGHGSRLAWLELEQQHIDRQQELAELRLRQDETRASIAALLEQRARIESEFRRHVRARLVELERLAISLMQELAKADQHLAYQRLIAPIDGVVHQLAVHTIGGVVNAGETLMLIVPENDALEIEAMVPNRDIGFIAVGQRAELRLEAFPYTIYGTLGGRVRDIGRDAVDDPRLGLVFPTRVALDRAAIRVEGRDIALVPGMRATIDIVTERRRVAEVLLAPLLRLRHEAMRER